MSFTLDGTVYLRHWINGCGICVADAIMRKLGRVTLEYAAMGVHVYPINDIREHDTDGLECECDPRIEWIDRDTGLPYPEGPLIVHNSYDGRELLEAEQS